MRHKKVAKREVQPDKVYANVLITKLINSVMRDGKKTIAERLVYNALEILKGKGMEPVETFEKVLLTIAPKVEIKARRIGGANYQVPTEVRPQRKNALAIRWLLEAAEGRPNSEFRTFSDKLVAEMLAVLQNTGEAIKKRDNTLRQAEANKAFSNFRW